MASGALCVGYRGVSTLYKFTEWDIYELCFLEVGVHILHFSR